MAIQLQLRRGTDAQNDTFVGANGEVTVDTTVKTLRVHDGITVGGTALINETTLSTSIAALLSSIYPVGSVYIGTQSTCPMETLIPDSVWATVGTSIVTSVNATADVKGTGKSLGFTNGSTIYGTRIVQGTVTASALGFSTQTVNANVGSTSNNYDTSNDSKVFGITTDSTKSGLTADVTRSTITVNVWQRTA